MISNFKKHILFIICIFWMFGALADTLSLQQAITITIENNHGLKVAQLQTQMAENLATPGNANLYPKLALTGGTHYSNQNTTILFSGNIPKNEVKGAVSTGYNTALGLSYTLFDGLGVVYNYRKLHSQAEKSGIQWQLTLENTLIQVINTYIEALRWQNTVAVFAKTLAVSEERVKRAEKAFVEGAKTSLDKLNAQVDFTNDSINYANALFQLTNMKRNLNWFMGRDIETPYVCLTPQTQQDLTNVSDIVATSLKNNRNHLIASLNKEIADLDYSIANSKRFPVLTGNMSYGITHAQNGAGIVVSSDNAGISAGLNLSFNLFDGLKVKTQIDNAALAIASNEELKKENEKSIARDVGNAWAGYQFALNQMASENQHVTLAQLALKRSEEALKNGQISSLEYRQAQLNVQNAENRIYNTRLNLLKYYYELKRLNGSLIASS